jgi:hypothetical protein
VLGFLPAGFRTTAGGSQKRAEGSTTPSPSQSGRLAILILIGALASACASAPATPATTPLAKLENVNGIDRVVLVPKAVERIGIVTAPVGTVATGGGQRAVIPYSALIYDTKGAAFVYTNPAPLTFVRHSLRVEAIQGDRVILAEGPPAGVSVVTVGATQLLGIELGVGL